MWSANIWNFSGSCRTGSDDSAGGVCRAGKRCPLTLQKRGRQMSGFFYTKRAVMLQCVKASQPFMACSSTYSCQLIYHESYYDFYYEFYYEFRPMHRETVRIRQTESQSQRGCDAIPLCRAVFLEYGKILLSDVSRTFYSCTATSRATSIMLVKLCWRSSALVDSPVTRESDTVKIPRAFTSCPAPASPYA